MQCCTDRNIYHHELGNKIGGQVIPSTTFIVSKDKICEKLIAYNQESIIRELTYYGLLILPIRFHMS